MAKVRCHQFRRIKPLNLIKVNAFISGVYVCINWEKEIRIIIYKVIHLILFVHASSQGRRHEVLFGGRIHRHPSPFTYKI